jgi:hypothetical protein
VPREPARVPTRRRQALWQGERFETHRGDRREALSRCIFSLTAQASQPTTSNLIQTRRTPAHFQPFPVPVATAVPRRREWEDRDRERTHACDQLTMSMSRCVIVQPRHEQGREVCGGTVASPAFSPPPLSPLLLHTSASLTQLTAGASSPIWPSPLHQQLPRIALLLSSAPGASAARRLVYLLASLRIIC